MPPIHPWQPDATRDLVVRHLAVGECVVLPSEATYEIVGSALHPEALARLSAAATDRAAVVLAGYADLFDWLPMARGAGPRILRKLGAGPVVLCADSCAQGLWRHLPPAAQRLLEREGRLAVRVSPHEVWQELAPVDLPLVSVPIAGGIDAQEAARLAGDVAACVIDAGPTQFGKLPSVVQTVGRRCQVVHEGAVTREQIADLALCRIVFLCTGNTCRSPMAQALCEKLLADELGCAVSELSLHGYVVQSAGLSAMNGMAASPDAVRVVADIGADLSQHRSRMVSMELLLWADHIFCMTASHLAAFGVEPTARSSPHSLNPAPRLLSPLGDDVPDPIGGDFADYRTCAEQIIQYLRQRLPELLES